jgi:hypothetical protein
MNMRTQNTFSRDGIHQHLIKELTELCSKFLGADGRPLLGAVVMATNTTGAPTKLRQKQL